MSHQPYDQPYSFIVNAGIHTLILFVFLTVLFFTYISKLTESHVNQEVEQMVRANINPLLIQLYYADVNGDIPWSMISQGCALLETQYVGETKEVKQSNANLLDGVIFAIIALFLVVVALAVYWYKAGYQLGLKLLLLENAAIFMMVGMVELFFFQNVAAKYIPVLPSDVVTDLLERIKYNIENVQAV